MDGSATRFSVSKFRGHDFSLLGGLLHFFNILEDLYLRRYIGRFSSKIFYVMSGTGYLFYKKL